MSKEVIAENPRLLVLAAEIKTLDAQAKQMAMTAAMEIGKRLAEAKAAVGHGNWENWLQINVDYSQRTASNFIKVYEVYGVGQQGLFGKSINPQTVAGLSFTKALALLAIKDEDDRADFVAGHDIPSMSSRELQAAIKERDDAKAALDQLDAKSKADRKKAQEKLKGVQHDMEKSIEEWQKKYDIADRRRAELENLMEEQPEDSEAVQAAQEEIAGLKSELAKAQQEISGKKDKAAMEFQAQFSVLRAAADRMIELLPMLDKKYAAGMKKMCEDIVLRAVKESIS
jgi:hypothetical protein